MADLMIELLYEICKRTNEESRHRVLGGIFKTFDTMLREGRFTEIDKFLSKVEVHKLEIIFNMGILSITGSGRGHLANWVSFRDRVQAHLTATEGVDRMIKLMGTFRAI